MNSFAFNLFFGFLFMMNYGCCDFAKSDRLILLQRQRYLFLIFFSVFFRYRYSGKIWKCSAKLLGVGFANMMRCRFYDFYLERLCRMELINWIFCWYDRFIFEVLPCHKKYSINSFFVTPVNYWLDVFICTFFYNAITSRDLNPLSMLLTKTKTFFFS